MLNFDIFKGTSPLYDAINGSEEMPDEPNAIRGSKSFFNQFKLYVETSGTPGDARLAESYIMLLR